eukprot:c2569_g1_i1.p1 GENE.c2569_g1_i1~~c2569_g1_i1.p1  ORF type:complete len:214 (-),score=34.45 c2569_g1_i1:611-1219(-)
MFVSLVLRRRRHRRMVMLLLLFHTRSHTASIARESLQWDTHLSRFHDNDFKRMYRMSVSTFEFLAKIRKHIAKDTKQGMCSSSGSITPHSQLAMTLRYLAGASYLDLCLIHGDSDSALFACVEHVVTAINVEFALHFSLDQLAELQTLAHTFSSKHGNVLPGCVGALDGIAIASRSPICGMCATPPTIQQKRVFCVGGRGSV